MYFLCENMTIIISTDTSVCDSNDWVKFKFWCQNFAVLLFNLFLERYKYSNIVTSVYNV